jgi:hypothetical protein
MLTANPFAQNAFGKGELLTTVVRTGEELRLRYGILVHANPADQPPDLAAAYRDYVALTRED